MEIRHFSLLALLLAPSASRSQRYHQRIVNLDGVQEIFDESNIKLIPRKRISNNPPVISSSSHERIPVILNRPHGNECKRIPKNPWRMPNDREDLSRCLEILEIIPNNLKHFEWIPKELFKRERERERERGREGVLKRDLKESWQNNISKRILNAHQRIL